MNLCTIDKTVTYIPQCTSTKDCTPAPKDPTGTTFLCPSNTPPPQKTRAIITTIPCFSCIPATNIAYDSDKGILYVPTYTMGILGINTATGFQTNLRDPINDLPIFLAYNSNNGKIYGVMFSDEENIFVVDPKTNVPNLIDLGDRWLRYYIAFNQINNKIYVAAESHLSVIDDKTDNVIKNISFDNLGVGTIGIDTNTGNIYMTGGNNVQVLNGTTDNVITTINKVGNGYPQSVTFDPNNGFMYIANGGAQNSIDVIDTKTNTEVTNISVPTSVQYPNSADGTLEGIVFNPVDNNVYAVFSGVHPLVVIDTKTNTIVNVPPIEIPLTTHGFHYGMIVDPIKDVLFIAGNPITKVQLNPSPPKISITQPINGSIIFHLSSINGTASDDIHLTSVTASVDGGSPQTAIHSSGTWTFPVTLPSGEHTINATATGVIGLTNKTAPTHFTLYNPSKGKVSGEGKLGNDILFDFNVHSKDGKTSTGHLDYQDKQAHIDIDSKNMTLLSVYDSFTNAAFVGQSKLNDDSNLQSTFVVQVNDPGTNTNDGNDDKANNDKFSIKIFNSTGAMTYQNSGVIKGHIKIDKLPGNDDSDENKN